MIINAIDTKDISVVVQGPIDEELTILCLNSIRKYLPDSEIILSTWENSNIKNLDYDILVLNKDTGEIISDFVDKVINNTNRQLLNTQSGLNKASRKYAFKIRTDCVLLNNNFINYFNKFEEFNDKYKIFQNRVIVSSVYSKEYSLENNLIIPFHVSDFYFFGLTEDIKDYFMETKLLTVYDISEYNFKYNNLLHYRNYTARYSAEQYYCWAWAKRKFKDIKFDDVSDINYKSYQFSLNIMYNNFIFLDLEQSGIYNKKHSSAFYDSRNIDNLINYEKFKRKYIKLCVDKEDYEIDELSYWANNLIGYLDIQVEKLKNDINRYKITILDIICSFIFSIEYFYNKKIITILGFKITIKCKEKNYK